MSQTPDYKEIKSLVDSTSTRGDILEVQFRCPRTGQTVTSHGSLPNRSSSGGRSKRGSSTIVRILLSIAQMFLFRRLRLGWGSRRAARRLTRGATRGMMESDSSRPSSTDKRRAIVEAFQKVQNRFNRQPNGTWTLRG